MDISKNKIVNEANDAIYFAKTNFRGDERVFGIKNPDRRQHFYIIGKSGTGKTSLLANLALQDIMNGKGLAIVDPHGDFVEEVVEKIPEERAKDVIYFNPVDTEYPIGFNVLEVSDIKYKHLIASDLMGIFTKIWANVWSARMEYILNNCVLALIDTPGTTLLGIPRILVDKEYRQAIVANIKDPVVRSFWLHEYEAWRDQFRNEAIVPIQNKVGQFLSTPLIRNIVGQPKSSMNIHDVMNEGKILLVNVSKGRLGEDNSQLLGAMLITKIQLAAMERVRIPEEERQDFYLYVDEFQNFATDSFASILSEARKYRLNLIIANQYIGQLVTDVSTKVRDAIFGNVGTTVMFRVGAADAEFLEKEFEPEFTIQDMVNLPNHNIYLKLMVHGVASRPFSAKTLPPIGMAYPRVNREKIVEMSRELYASKREDVEEQVKRWNLSVGEGGAEEDLNQAQITEEKTEEKHKAICWVCEKETEVNFKPIKGRAIYCQDCLRKIEKGEISPINLPRVQNRDQKKYEPTLGKLGIEFEETPSREDYKPFRRQEPRKDFGFSANRPSRFNMDLKNGELVIRKEGAEELSLKNLKREDFRNASKIKSNRPFVSNSSRPVRVNSIKPVDSPRNEGGIFVKRAQQDVPNSSLSRPSFTEAREKEDSKKFSKDSKQALDLREALKKALHSDIKPSVTEKQETANTANFSDLSARQVNSVESEKEKSFEKTAENNNMNNDKNSDGAENDEKIIKPGIKIKFE